VRLLLDTGVLGHICHPRRHADVRAWFGAAVGVHTFLVSELADYELRRELLRVGATRSVARLDELGRELRYVPVSTSTWRRAADLGATARKLRQRDRADARGESARVIGIEEAFARARRPGRR
jgi:predicted nucleic acid-binding protein